MVLLEQYHTQENAKAMYAALHCKHVAVMLLEVQSSINCLKVMSYSVYLCIKHFTILQNGLLPYSSFEVDDNHMYE